MNTLYQIVAKHKKNNRWEVIDDTNELTEALRWSNIYNKSKKKEWTLRIRRHIGNGRYTFIDYKGE